MPCRDYRDDEPRTVENPETKRRLDRVTRMLCSMCKLAEQGDAALPANVAAWWEKHKEEDRKRIQAAERRNAAKTEEYEAKLAAYKKLNPKERAMLGVTKPSPPELEDEL